MKKISLFTLAMATGWASMAQVSTDPSSAHKPVRTEMSTQPRFGLRGGVSLSSLELDDDYNATNYSTNSKTTFHAGAFVNIPLGRTFRIQPEISYYGGGSKVRGNLVSNPLQTSGTGNYELDFHYIGIPVMFQLHTGSNGFFVEAGPQASFLIQGQEEPSGGNKINLKERELVKQLDFGAAAGVGYISRIGLGLNARYVHGFSNVFNSDNAPAGTQDREISTRSIQIGLVYHFGAAK
jgi:hypothetical protein